MATLCKGWYYREKANREKDHTKAKKLLLKSIMQFKAIDPADKVVKQLELEFLKRKIVV